MEIKATQHSFRKASKDYWTDSDKNFTVGESIRFPTAA